MNKSIRIAIGSLAILAIATAIGKTSAKSEQTWHFVPGSVESGDTFKAVQENSKTEKVIRICGIKAPELNEPFGSESREALTNLLEKTEGNLKLKFNENIPREKNANFLVAEIYMSKEDSDINLGRELIVTGMVDKSIAVDEFGLLENCLVNQEDLTVLEDLNNQARSSKKGIYSEEVEALKKQKKQEEQVKIEAMKSEMIEISKYEYMELIKNRNELVTWRQRFIHRRLGDFFRE